MKKFLINFSLFFIPIVLIILFFEYRLSGIKNLYIEKKELYEKKMPNCEILILGSSHALYGINPVYLEAPAFNMANVSQPLYYDYKILEKYIDRMPNLKVVICPISYFTLDMNFFDEKFPEYWRIFYYKRFYNISSLKSPTFDPKNFSYIALYGNERSFLWGLKGFNINLIKEMNEFGFMEKEEQTINLSDKNGIERVSFHDSIMSEKGREENVRYLANIINILKAKNIQPVLITTPVYKTYSDHVNMDKYNWIQKTLSDIARKDNINYLNYFYDKRFIARDFYNSDHLNSTGAKKMTLVLQNDLNKFIKK